MEDQDQGLVYVGWSGGGGGGGEGGGIRKVGAGVGSVGLGLLRWAGREGGMCVWVGGWGGGHRVGKGLGGVGVEGEWVWRGGGVEAGSLLLDGC